MSLINICEKDEVYSYFGLREVRYDGYKFLLNDEEVFQKLVLDHISSTLLESKQAYSSVFTEYESLKNAINNVNNN